MPASPTAPPYEPSHRLLDRATIAPQIRVRPPSFARELIEHRPLIVNTARGGLVDEAAWVRGFDAGLVAGAGFGVVDGEPPRPTTR